jgi:hypothetical protein
MGWPITACLSARWSLWLLRRTNYLSGSEVTVMFQRLDQFRTGSMFIITGQAGAGKSHLAASTRRSGTVWILE